MAKTPIGKTLKELLEKYPEYVSDDYIWNKDLDKYTQKEIDVLDAEKIDLIYQNGSAILKEIYDVGKIEQTRMTLLLGYLLLFATGLLGYAVQGSAIEHPIILVLLSALYFILSLKLYILLMSQALAMIHFSPSGYMTKEKFKYDKKVIKIEECKRLQVIARYNWDAVTETGDKFEKYIIATIILTFATIATAIYFSVAPYFAG